MTVRQSAHPACRCAARAPLLVVAVSAGFGYVAGALATHWKMTPRFVSAIRVGVALVMALPVALGLIIAFGTIANADAAAKATLLAKGISEALTCTPLVLPGAAALVATGLWHTWRWIVDRGRDE